MKQGLIGLLIGVIIAAGIGAYIFTGSPIKQGETTYTTDIVASKLTEISELSTLDYHYRNAASLDTEQDTLKLFDFDIPFTGKRLVVVYEGDVKMGPDMSKVGVEMNGKNVAVTIPHSSIISHELNEESFEYLIEESGLFNPLTQDDGGQFRIQQKEVIEKSIEEKGLLDEADEKAKEQIKSFLTALDPAFEVTVNVK